MKVVMAVEMSEDPFYAFGFDGVVGLGLSALSLQSSFNFFGMLTSQSLLPEPHIAIFLAENDTDPSEMMVGGHNPARLLSPLQWAPVAQPELGHWQVKIKGITLGGKPIDFCDDGECTGVLDTGTSHFGVPELLLREFSDALSTWHSVNESVDCRDQSGAEVRLEVEGLSEGISMTLNTKDYARRLPFPYNNPLSPHTAVCRPRVMRVRHAEKMFILGEPILRRYYTVFDWTQKRLGFGLANHEPNDLVIMLQVTRHIRLAKRAPKADVKLTFRVANRAPTQQ